MQHEDKPDYPVSRLHAAYSSERPHQDRLNLSRFLQQICHDARGGRRSCRNGRERDRQNHTVSQTAHRTADAFGAEIGKTSNIARLMQKEDLPLPICKHGVGVGPA